MQDGDDDDNQMDHLQPTGVSLYSPLLGTSSLSSFGASAAAGLGSSNGTHVRVPYLRSLHHSRRPTRSHIVLLALFATCAFGWMLATPETVHRVKEDVASFPTSLTKLVQPCTSSSHRNSAEARECNPFTVPGQIQTIQGNVDANWWQPWDPACNASTLFTDLRNRVDMPWLHNKTVAILGDSISRDHIEYACEMSRGNMEWIWEGTRFDPPLTYSRGDPKNYNSSQNGHSEGGADQSRPRICTVEHYDFAIVFVFHFGLSDGTAEERAMQHFYPPFLFADRLHSILVPLLKSAGRWPPTLLEFSTGTWDLQHFTNEDRVDDTDRMSPLSEDRARWYQDRFSKALTTVEQALSQAEIEKRRLEHAGGSGWTGIGITQPALVYRELLHTKMVDAVPPPRVHGLKDLQRYVLEKEGKLKEHEGGRWSIDPLGSILLGQEHNYRDSIHPIQLPAGKLWGDIMLYKLKQAVSQQQRNH